MPVNSPVRDGCGVQGRAIGWKVASRTECADHMVGTPERSLPFSSFIRTRLATGDDDRFPFRTLVTSCSIWMAPSRRRRSSSGASEEMMVPVLSETK